jgi:hypothetical protein
MIGTERIRNPDSFKTRPASSQNFSSSVAVEYSQASKAVTISAAWSSILSVILHTEWLCMLAIYRDRCPTSLYSVLFSRIRDGTDLFRTEIDQSSIVLQTQNHIQGPLESRCVGVTCCRIAVRKSLLLVLHLPRHLLFSRSLSTIGAITIIINAQPGMDMLRTDSITDPSL